MSEQDSSLLCTVSTVKDTWSNIAWFVESNLASGADHMFVFLEADDPDVTGYLADHPHVTPVLTDDTYWAGTRPEELIQRQIVNANLVNFLLAGLPGVGWLAHIDGDECLELDMAALAEAPDDARAVRLAIREAVSTEHGSRDVKQFKKKLGPKQLERLVRQGVLPRPANHVLLKGHLIGKSLARPALDLAVGIHRASGPDGVELEHYRGTGFRVMHYDCVSFDDFVRKWTSHVGSGGTAFRDERLLLLRSVERLVADKSLSDDDRRAEMRTLYKEHVEDDVALLESTGILQSWHDDWHHHRPRPFPSEVEDDLGAFLSLLLTADKRIFRQRRDQLASIAAVRDLAAELDSRHGDLRRRIEAAAVEAEGRVAAVDLRETPS